MQRHGGDKRGSAQSRRARKYWMLNTFGDGETCPCVHCGKTLTFNTVEADRKIPGGPYARWNVQPADRGCNLARSDNPNWVSPLAKASARISIVTSNHTVVNGYGNSGKKGQSWGS